MEQSETVEPWRGRLIAFIEHPVVLNVITGLILFNAVMLGIETYPIEAAWFHTFLPALDVFIVSVFIIELSVKMIAYRGRFFRSGWNWFDLIVVSVSLFPDTGAITVLRALRILRALRLFSVAPALRGVIEALLRAIPGMGAIVAVLLLMFYVSAVMATKLFGATTPDLFGTLGTSAFTLFQVMTLEGWHEVAGEVMAHHAYAWIFFITFIVVASFAILNLFIAVMVQAMQSKHFDADAARDAEALAARTAMAREIVALRGDIAGLREALSQGSPESSRNADDRDE